MGLIRWKKKEIKTRPSRSWLNRLAEKKKIPLHIKVGANNKAMCANWLRLVAVVAAAGCGCLTIQV